MAPFAALEILSPRGDLTEAAANLFAAMRRLDDQELDLIVARPVPPTGLGEAINDRLRQATCAAVCPTAIENRERRVSPPAR